jgi:intracellular multiplication protein IcmL
MFKDFLNFLDKISEDGLNPRIEREAITKKYWFFFTTSILSLIGTVLMLTYMVFFNHKSIYAQTYVIKSGEHTAKKIITLPYPFQSFLNVSNWADKAIMAIYSFNFLDYNKNIEKSKFYFTSNGYETYLNALKNTKVLEEVQNKKLEINTIPTHDPILINWGYFGSNKFWRYKIPVLVGYYGGKNPIHQNYMIELLIVRTTTEQNPKGLEIAEFNMQTM